MRLKVGIGIIVLREARILLGVRKTGHGAGTWGCPGGHLEMGETPEECAKRELFEETGFIAETVEKGPWLNVQYPDGTQAVSIFMVVTRFGGELFNPEVDKTESWHWYPASDLPSPLFKPLEHLCENGSIEPFLLSHMPQVGYLAAPHSHPDPQVREKRLCQVAEVASALMNQGTYVFSPLGHNIPLVKSGLEWDGWGKWRAYDLTMLSLCKKLIVLKLPGWKESPGVQAEIAFAKEKNFPIIEMNYEDVLSSHL